MSDLQQQLRDFTTTLVDLLDGLSVIPSLTNSIVFQNIDLVRSSIKSNSEKVLDQFIIHVLPYKEKIDSGDEDFFLSHDYSKHTQGQENGLQKVLEFKSVWTDLTKENKDTIKQYMQILCFCANEYFKLKFM